VFYEIGIEGGGTFEDAGGEEFGNTVYLFGVIS
jgi:hypothetical protein